MTDPFYQRINCIRIISDHKISELPISYEFIYIFKSDLLNIQIQDFNDDFV
jgi:hypothetical protein